MNTKKEMTGLKPFVSDTRDGGTISGNCIDLNYQIIFSKTTLASYRSMLHSVGYISLGCYRF